MANRLTNKMDYTEMLQKVEEQLATYKKFLGILIKEEHLNIKVSFKTTVKPDEAGDYLKKEAEQYTSPKLSSAIFGGYFMGFGEKKTR